MAEADPAAKSTATQKLLPRALRWFRGGAILTFLTGLAILGKRLGESPLGAGAWSTPWAITILTGALFGTLMFLNVVLVIWPKQQIVIASAKAAASGGQANALAPAAARRAFLASRTNVVFSIPMLFFMGAPRTSRFRAAAIMPRIGRCHRRRGAARGQLAHRDQRGDHKADRENPRRHRHGVRRVGRGVRARPGVSIGLTA